MGTRTWRRSFPVACIVMGMAVLATLGENAAGQDGGYAPPGQKKSGPTFTNKTEFNLPVRMNDRDRGNLREMQLFCRKPGTYGTPGTEWSHVKTIGPMETKFVFKAPQDGEYWFTVVTIDRAGRATPADVNLVPPGLKVIVDTQPPILEVRPIKGQDGETYVRCIMIDEHPNPSSVRLICRGIDGERPIEPVDPQRGVFRITSKTGVPVRVTGSDQCGNVVSQGVNFKELMGTENTADSTTGANRLDPNNVNQHSTTEVKSVPPVPTNDRPAGDPWQPPAAGGSITQTSENAVRVPPGPSAMPIGVPNSTMSNAASQLISVAPASGNRRILNTTHASIDYRVGGGGPSGVSKVQVYVTGDHGQSWQILREDTDKRNPIDVRLPGEGVFGVTVVLTNGNGFGGTPPRSGDAPSYWIEVDTTAPFVQLQPTELVSGGGALEIRWTASDKNLAAEPISLFYRTRQDAPWQPIARNLKNDGHFRWIFPRSNEAQFFFKMEAVDQAGNVARSESPTAVVLDMAEPRATIINVSGSDGGNGGNNLQRINGPQGN